MFSKRLFVFFLGILLSAAVICQGMSAFAGKAKADPLEARIDELIEKMSPEERIAQLFFVTPEALSGASLVTSADGPLLQAFQKFPVGGIIFMEANLESDAQTRAMLTSLQKFAEKQQQFPVFLGVDEEGGRVQRIGGREGFSAPALPSAKVLGAAGPEASAAAGVTIGQYLRGLGFNLDFAPVTDIVTNPENQVISDRAFGCDPVTVTQNAAGFAAGLRLSGIVPCYKHFPGHGDTSEDSHSGYAYSYKKLDELRRTELIPFIKGSEADIEMIMVSHVSFPNINGGDLPASLSKVLVRFLLREEIGYRGIIITDALNMKAVSDHYTAGDAVLRALDAGCDMLLMCAHFPEGYAAALSAYQSGILSEKRVEDSLRRILRVKLGER